MRSGKIEMTSKLWKVRNSISVVFYRIVGWTTKNGVRTLTQKCSIRDGDSEGRAAPSGVSRTFALVIELRDPIEIFFQESSLMT